jgi:hypothetical protein
MLAARLRRVGLTLEHDDLERWRGGWALPWHRADLGFFGAHALSRCARVARMDSCGPLLATHFLLEKQVEARAYGASGTNYFSGFFVFCFLKSGPVHTPMAPDRGRMASSLRFETMPFEAKLAAPVFDLDQCPFFRCAVL